MRTLDDYLHFITSEHRGRPKFEASLSAAVAPIADLDSFLQTIPSLFDLDYAVGVQLDATGLWIGRSRLIPEPLPNQWFSFDTYLKGWDQGRWKGPYDVGTLLERLDDETYRRLLRAKIMVNNWNGTIPAAQDILDEFFTDPATYVMVEDNANIATGRLFFSFDDPNRGFEAGEWYVAGTPISTLSELDMSVTVGVAGQIPSIVDLEIFSQNLIPLNIGGVKMEVSVTSVDGCPLFGFDVQNKYVSGFETGALGVSPDALVDMLEPPETLSFDLSSPGNSEFIAEVV